MLFLQSPFDEQHVGRIELRRQRDTGFVENADFDAKLLTSDARY
jgi:hypothetical protein